MQREKNNQIRKVETMDEKKLMELAGKLEKEELLQLVGRMAQASGSARKVME
jgi:hypothetical protein